MAKKLKCYWCNEKDYDENMETVQQGSQKKRYHKKDCYDAYLEYKRELDKKKCSYCKEKDHEGNLLKKERGKQVTWYHQTCKDFKDKEKKEKDNLVEVIKETHGISLIPPQFYSFLEDIRNGNEFFGRVGEKKSKEGYSYTVIAETYKYCQDSIDWAIKNKTFNNVLNLLKYTRAIIINNIEDAEMSMEKHEEWEVFNNSGVEDAFDVPEFNDNKNDKKETKDDELDISDFI